jgi:hypothetical protein
LEEPGRKRTRGIVRPAGLFSFLLFLPVVYLESQGKDIFIYFASTILLFFILMMAVIANPVKPMPNSTTVASSGSG